MHTKINLRATRLGRLIARLAGEEKGAVMMEYVVLAVLLVAGVVAAVIAFGGRIVASFKAAGEATGGQTTTAGTTVTDANKNYDADIKKAVTEGGKITGNEFKPTSVK